MDDISTRNYKEITCSTEEKGQAKLTGGRLLVVLLNFSHTYVSPSVNQCITINMNYD